MMMMRENLCPNVVLSPSSSTSLKAEDSERQAEEMQTLRQQVALDANTCASLRHDIQLLNSRISRTNSEHREVRNHWLNEKADVEGRLFQLQALVTQVQAKSIKKEKDYDRLQLQLSKVVKDAARGNKAIITISQPLKKNLSQVTAMDSKGSSKSNNGNGSLLKDAEIIANKNTITNLEKENASLRNAMQSMQENISTLQENFDSSIALVELKYKNQIDTLIAEHFVKDECLQQKDESIEDMKARLATATDEAAAKAAIAATLAALTPPVRHRVIPGSLAKQYLDGTPGARPVRWVVEQVNTEIKRLRDRADRASQHAGAGTGNSPFPRSSTKTPKTQTQGKVNRNQGDRNNDRDEDYREYNSYGEFLNSNPKYSAMKSRLLEAMAVIQEQDRLIHLALLGQMNVGYRGGSGGWGRGGGEVKEDAEVEQEAEGERETLGEEDEEIKEEETKEETDKTVDKADKDGDHDTQTAVHRASTPSHEFYDESDEQELWFEEIDFLPPASPATIEILQSFGWNVPRQLSHSQSHSHSHSSQSRTSLSQSQTKAGTGLSYYSLTHVIKPSSIVQDCEAQHLDF